MIFYIHGWHKLEGWIAYLQNGTPWKLAEEVAGMHFPAPFASAVAATLVQFICSMFVVVGLFTRINAALLVCVLSGAILQNQPRSATGHSLYARRNNTRLPGWWKVFTRRENAVEVRVTINLGKQIGI